MKTQTQWIGYTLLTFVASVFFIFTAFGQVGKTVLFPHSKHLDNFNCSNCHTSEGPSNEPSYPIVDLCFSCHKDTLWEKVLPLGRLETNALFKFSHQIHSEQKCRICHVITEDTSPTLLNQADCEKCHFDNQIEMDCSKCHKNNFLPSYHNGAWRRTHGINFNRTTDSARHGHNCKMCHRPPECATCHQTRKPVSHNGFFRMRGHGLKAEIERKSCGTCHKEIFCIKCHRGTKPLNHKGIWKYSHGLTLAIPGGRGGPIGKCSVCHDIRWCASCHNK